MDTNSHECLGRRSDLWSVKLRGSHAPLRSARLDAAFFRPRMQLPAGNHKNNHDIALSDAETYFDTSVSAFAGTAAVASTVKKKGTAQSGKLSRQL